MKPAVDRATTAKVLADIDSVLRERTAAAVERVLATATPGHSGYETDHVATRLLLSLCDELGIEPAPFSVCRATECECWRDDCYFAVDATPGLERSSGGRSR